MYFSGHNTAEAKKPKMLWLETVCVNSLFFLKKTNFRNNSWEPIKKTKLHIVYLRYHLGVYISLHRPPLQQFITSVLEIASPTPAKTQAHFLTEAIGFGVNTRL